jgi:hypothetical protein
MLTASASHAHLHKGSLEFLAEVLLVNESSFPGIILIISFILLLGNICPAPNIYPF